MMLDGKTGLYTVSAIDEARIHLAVPQPVTTSSPSPHTIHTPTIGVAGRCRWQHPWASSISMECAHLSMAGLICDKDDRCASSEDISQTKPLPSSGWMDGWLRDRRPETPKGSRLSPRWCVSTNPWMAVKLHNAQHHNATSMRRTQTRGLALRHTHTHTHARTHAHTTIRGSYQRHPGDQNPARRELHPALMASAGHVWTSESSKAQVCPLGNASSSIPGPGLRSRAHTSPASIFSSRWKREPWEAGWAPHMVSKTHRSISQWLMAVRGREQGDPEIRGQLGVAGLHRVLGVW